MSNAVDTHEVFAGLVLATDYHTTSLLGGQLAEDIVHQLDNEKTVKTELDQEGIELGSSEQNDSYFSVANPLYARTENSSEVLNRPITSVNDDRSRREVPNLWSSGYIGLYCQYAGVGLLWGSSGTLLPFCVYTYHGASNVCSNSRNIVTFAWSFKVLFAVITDSVRLCGLRRKPWMLLGWSGVLLIYFGLACAAHTMTINSWLISLLLSQCFLMLSDVPADGYCVELGQIESPERRGQILATGQRIRFTFCIVAGLIQTFLLNGPTTNDANCSVSFENCWSWGFTINQYYGLLFGLLLILTVPILWLKEIETTRLPPHDFKHFIYGIWVTLQSLTTFYLIIFVIGNHSLTNFTNNATIYLQYYVIKLTNFQAGIDTLTSYGALVIAITLFQRYLINKNWRYTQYSSTVIATLLGLIWIAPFYNEGGTMNAWFTIFIDLDTSFAQGLSQVLYSMAVIELARPGQEATTYELIVTVGNAALTLNGIISTQLLYPLHSSACSGSNCDRQTVDVSNRSTYYASHGPSRFTNYTLVLTALSLVSCYAFTRFLPGSKDECSKWRLIGEQEGMSVRRGIIATILAGITVTVSAKFIFKRNTLS